MHENDKAENPDNAYPTRKPTRLPDYDYSQNGCYFVTVCVKDKQYLLGHYKAKQKIVGAGLRARPQDALVLSELGREVEKTIQYIDRNYDNVHIETAIVMPNQIHLLVTLDDFESRQTGGRGNPPLQNVIGQLKSYTTKRYRELTHEKDAKLWQRGFYEHIIRNETEFRRAWEYIEYNALKEYGKSNTTEEA